MFCQQPTLRKKMLRLMKITSKSYRIQMIANQIIETLWNDGQPNRAALSGLRNAKTIGDHQAVPALPILLGYMPKDELSQTGKPTRGEIAVFTAVKAYALYQQGKSGGILNKDSGTPVISALSKLKANDPTLQKPLDRRMENLLSTTQLGSIQNQLLRIVLILRNRGDDQPLAFSQLARDLYDFQTHVGAYNGAQHVILRWSQQYYAIHQSRENTKE